MEAGLPLRYLYVGAVVPVALLLLRQALDFSYKEELVMNTLTDYVEQIRTWAEEIPAEKKKDPVLQEEVVERITSSIKQTALPEVISARCSLLRKKKSCGRSFGNLWCEL